MVRNGCRGSVIAQSKQRKSEADRIPYHEKQDLQEHRCSAAQPASNGALQSLSKIELRKIDNHISIFSPSNQLKK